MDAPHPPSGFVFWARTAWGLCKGLPVAVKREVPKTWGTLRMQQQKLARRLRPVTWPAIRTASARVVQPTMRAGARAKNAVVSYLESRNGKARQEFKQKGVMWEFNHVAANAPKLIPYKGVPLKKPLTTSLPKLPPPAAPAAAPTPPVDKSAAARAAIQRHAAAPPRPPAPTKTK
jgi:hypothetical protein